MTMSESNDEERFEEINERLERIEDGMRVLYDERNKKADQPKGFTSESLTELISDFLQTQWDVSNEPITLRSISTHFNKRAAKLQTTVQKLIDTSKWNEGILKSSGYIYWPKTIELSAERKEKLATISFEDFQLDFDDPEQNAFVKECNEKGIGSQEAIHRFIAKKNKKPFVPLRTEYETFEEEQEIRRNPPKIVPRISKEELGKILKG